MSADLPMAPLVPPTVEPTTAPAAVHFLAPRELVVLDGTLPDADVLLDAIAADRPDTDLMVLDPTRDALDQIGDRLAGGAPVSAIHLVAHGQAGQFVIRGAVIDASELARRTAQLQTWNLADHADILLYGCNIADGANGEAFVRMMAELTGADVAASTDLTGSEDRGGDWTLEFATGDIDTATIAGPRLKGRWYGTLDATPVAAGDTALPSFSTPLAFERNAGQTDAAVEFLARGSGYTVFLDDGDAVIDVRHGDGTGNVVRLSLDGAQTPVGSTGGNLLSGTSHYLTGDVSDWHRDVAHYGSVRFDEVYDGIDVQYYGADRRLEYDFLVDAGVDTDVIGLRIEGAVAVEIAENGELVLTLDGPDRTMTFHAPVTYQRAADGSREHVDSRYVLRADGTVGFDLGEYDRSRDLVIDPILGYATYLGGTGLETIEGVETDSSGNVYVTGRTGSAAFPTSVGAYDTSLGGSTDAFVTKFNSAGALQYSTYFGGTGNEWAYNLTVDGSGQVYAVGETSSSDLAIVNGADSTFAGSSEGFLVKLNATGSAILYSTYYGGANADYLAAVHMGSGSTVYVAGGTIAATWDGYGGAIDTSASGAGSLTWSQTYAAAGTEKLYDMDVDSTGDIWLIGETSTASLGYGNAYDSTHNGSADVFLVRMSSTGTVEYVSYYGGTGNDYGNGIVVAADNTLYITGNTFSTGGIASTGAYDTTGDGTNGKAFVVHLDPSQSGSAQRLFGTYYGTSGSSSGLEIAIDAEGRPVVVGQTAGTLPTTVTARDTTLSGSSDGFVAIFAADGSTLRYGSYLGGDGTESANAVAVDTSGRLYVVGQTASTTVHTTGAYDTTGDATNADGFIAQFLPLASAARTSGKGGLSINTDGGNDAYLIADNGGAILGSRTALTLEFDFAIGTNSSGDNTLFSYAVAGQSNEVTVNVKSTGVIELDIEFVTRATSVAYPQLLDGNRHQVAITWDRATGNGAFYVDGVLVESFTGFKTGATIDGGGTLVLGQEQDSLGGGFSTSQMFSGTLYDVRVFSDVRTATEIRAGRLAELPRTESGMVAHWRFDDWHADGTTTEAVSGNDLTLGHASGTAFVTSQPSLTFVMNENAATGTVVGSITALSDDRQARIDALLAADATLTYSAQTDKFYKRDTTFRTWASALSLATSTTLNTVAGQLVTVRSATENALLSSITGGSAVWLGAADASVEGTWRWYDGSTPAESFWQGTASGYRIDGAYTNWNAGEPSDTGGEDRLYQQADGTWNDAPDGMTSWTLIEWDADEVLDASQAITYAITSQTVTGAFAIDSDTGILTVADGDALNYVAGVPHTLTVRVTEGSLTYDGIYTVVLTDEVVEVSGSTPGAQSVDEDTTLTFSSGGGNAISVSDGSGASDTRMQVSLSVSQGTLSLSQTTGLTIVSGANGSAALVIDGTESALNAALAGMTYTPAAEYSGSDTLQVTASLSSELAARYTFDTGAVADSAAGTAQNGSFVGNATTTTDATRGTVLSLDGAGDSVQIASVFGNPSNVTVGGWVNLYTAVSRGEMISLDDRVHIALDEPGIGVKGSIQTGVGTWNDLESGRFIAGDGWHHVMFVVDDANDVNTLYIDGIAVASETNTSSVYWTGATTTYLGQHPGNTAYLHGLLDDMLVYTRALSADEVAALAAEQRTTDPDTVTLTVNAVNDAPEDLYFVPELAESSLTGVYTFSVGNDLGRDAAGEDAAMTLYGSPGQTTGPTGSGALDLAGGVSGQYGDIAGITTGGAMTIAGQVRFDTTAAWQRIVDFGQANSTGITAIYVGRFGTSNDLTFTLEKDLGGGNWSVYRATAAGAIVDGSWMHFAATVDGTGAMALYVNGALADTEAGAVPEVGVRTNNFVGRSNWAGDALFDGAIDNLVVASGALSATGVAALYQQSNAVTIADNAADGTVLGTIVVADVDSANTHSFSLTDSAAGRFAIAADGTLRVGMGSLLEYASATSHTLTARATDAGSLTRDESFSVTVTAANEAPSFAPGDGKLTTSFGSSDDATAVAVQADGKIVIAGYSGATFIVGRYNADGTLDSTFGTGGLVTTLVGSSAAARAIALQSDGKILVAGTSYNGVNDDFALVRYNTDGSLDTTFDTDGKVTTAIGAGNDRGTSVAVQSDGKIVVGGTSHNGTDEDFAVVRYTTTGALDTTFDTDGRVTTAVGTGDDLLTDIALQTDGGIVAVGYGSNGANNDFAVVRYDTNGALDTTFDTDGKVLTAIGSGADQAESVAIQSDGKIVVSGSANNGSNDDFALARYDTNGALDTGFDTDGRVVTTFGGGTGHEYGSSVAIQTDGKIVVAGRTLASGNSDFAIARYTTAGALDTTFDTDGKVTTDFSGSGDLGRALAIQSDGKFVVAGMTWTGAGFDVGVARYLATGALDTGFDSAFVTTLDGAPGFTEGGSLVVLDGNVSVTDPELSAADDFSGATLTLARNGGAIADDQFAFDGTTVTVSGANVLVSGTQVGTYVSTGGQLAVTFGANATQARVNTLMRNIRYGNASDTPPASVQIDWTFSDGNAGAQGSGGALTATGSTTVGITAVNDAPVISALDGDVRAYTEGGTAVLIGSANSLTDADSTDFSGGALTVSFTGGSDSAEDVLGIRNEGTGAGQIGVSGGDVTYGGVVMGTWTGGSAGANLVITLNANADTASTLALINNLTYENTDTALPTTTNRSIRVVLTDGDGGTSANSATTMTVTGVNDAPAFSALDGAPSHTEGGAAVILDANATVSDAELSAADAFSGATLNLARNGGADADDALAFDGTNVTVSGANVLVGGTQVGTYVFTGGELVVTFGANATQARVHTLLQNIVYWNWSDTPPASVQIDWTFSDGNAGAQGSGGALTATGSTTVTITAVNDAPSGADGTILATEDTAYTFVPGDFGFTDTDGDVLQRVWIDTLPASGALLWNGSTFAAGNWIDASDIAAGQLTYAPAADVTGTAVASFAFRVQDDGGTGNGGSDTDPVANTITIDVTAVNDAPARIVLDASGGSSIALNTTTAGDQSQPALAALPGGGWVAVWTSAGQDGDGTGIYSQRFDASGVALGAEFRVNASATYHQGSPSVATFSDGAFVVGWTEMQPGFAAWAEARVFAADGTPLTGDLTISVPLSNPNEGYAAQVQVLGPNRWAIVWSNEVNGAARSVEGRIFDRTGAAQTAQFTVGTSGAAPDSWAVVPRATGLADGGMAVTWNHYDTFSQTTIRVQFVNADGTLRSAFAGLSGTGIGDIAQLPDSRVVVLSTDGATVYATVFSAAGAITVPDFVVTSSHTSASWPQVTASGDGFVAAWTALANDGVTQEIAIQRYDATGAPLGVATRARPSADGAIGDIALTTLADGSALLGWRADGLDGSGGGAYAGALQAAVREGAANGTVVAGAIDVLDPDGGDTHTFSLFDDAGGRFTIDGVTGRITVANGGLLDYETGTTHTIIVRATDGGGLSVDRSLTIAVLPVNEAPAFSNLDGTPTFAENGSPVVLDGDVTVSDVELTATDDFNGTTLTLARNGGASTQDQFSATGTLGTLTQGGNLVVGGTTIGTVTTHGAGSLVLTFNGSATNALVNSALQQIAYANSSDTPPASVQIDWTFSDVNAGAQGSGGALTATGSTTVSITAVNDVPTGAVAVTGNPAEGETLSADTSGLADADGLGTFAYQWLRDGAPIAGATASSHTLVSGDVGRGISVRVSYTDGGGTSEQVTSAAVGPVTPAPTPPANTAPANAAPVEDTPFAFTGADTISIADGDGNLTTVSASVSFGSLVLTLTGGATVSAGALGSAAFTLSGSLASLNASLASLAYTPDADFDGTDTLTLVSTDSTALSDTDTITLSVTPVDDAPVLTGLTLSVAQGGTTTLSTADFTIVDPDGPGGTRVVDVRNLSQGTFELTTAPGVPVTSFDFADVAAGLVRFVHSGAGAAPAFEASVRDSLTPGTFVPAAVGFTPTPVVTTPGPSPEQAYSIVLTPTTPPSETPQETSSGPARPADPVTTGTASQSGETAQGAGGRGERSPGSVDPRILMLMAVPRTPAAAGGDASGNTEVGRGAATVGAAGSSAGVGVSAPTAALVGSSGVPAGAQVPTVEAVTPDEVHSAWNAPAPLTVTLPGDGPASGPENRSAEEQQFDIMVNGVRLTGVSLSVGVVTWALRAGGIVSSLLASLPAWRFVDPLPVLERAERARVVWRDDEDDGEGDDTAKRDRAVEDLFGGPS